MLDVRHDSKGNKFRARRIVLLKKLISSAVKERGACSVLDIGGTYNFWHVWREEIDWNNTRITCINTDPSHLNHGKEDNIIQMRSGDACDLSNIKNNEFDVLFSNSVIEHVGSWNNMKAMAKEVRRVAPRYLVQTPNFWFPIEPHARTPFLHWFPEPISYRIVMARKCGYWRRQTTVSGAVEAVQSAHLIDFRQMEALFDDAVIIREKFLGITKALIAIKDA